MNARTHARTLQAGRQACAGNRTGRALNCFVYRLAHAHISSVERGKRADISLAICLYNPSPAPLRPPPPHPEKRRFLALQSKCGAAGDAWTGSLIRGIAHAFLRRPRRMCKRCFCSLHSSFSFSLLSSLGPSSTPFYPQRIVMPFVGPLHIFLSSLSSRLAPSPNPFCPLVPRNLLHSLPLLCPAYIFVALVTSNCSRCSLNSIDPIGL